MSTVSVVMMNYNHARFLPAAIESVVAQDRLPDEFIILDDCSTDNSQAVIADYAARHPFIRSLANPSNQGVLANVARLLEEAQGDFFFSLAADDFVQPGFLAEAMRLLEAHPEAAFCTSLSLMVDEEGRDLGLTPVPIPASEACFLPPEEVRVALLRYGAWFMGNTAVYRCSALLAAGGFRPELRSYSDALVCHVLALKHGCCFIPEPFGAWRKMASGYAVSTNRDVQSAQEAVDLTAGLMAGEYADLFPPRYVRQWRRRQGYWIGEARLLKPLEVQQEGLRDVRRGVKHGCVGALAYLVAAVGCAALRLCTKLYLLLLSFAWPATPLMLKWWWRNLRHTRGGRT